MNLLDQFSSLSTAQALGWTLVHFIWQGGLIAAVLAAALALLRQRSANARYLTCCVGMAAMLAAPVVTLIIVIRSRADVAVLPPELFPLLEAGTPPVWHRLTPVLPWLTLLWLTGVFVFQTRLVLHWSRAQHLKHYGTRPGPPEWQRIVADLSRRLGVTRCVGIFESALATGPMVMGWLRPVILVPAGVLTGLTPPQLRTIIAHELAHVRRHDYVINFIQAVFESLLFYHPAVWWLSRRLRLEREYCCDDLAVGVCGDALCYARALSALDELRGDQLQTVLATTGGSLMNRIVRLLGVRPPASRRIGGWLAPVIIAASITAATLALVLTPPANAGEKSQTPPPVKKIEQKPDIAALAKKLGIERADVLHSLRKAGLDNDTLLLVLRQIEPDKDKIKKIEYYLQQKTAKKTQLDVYEAELVKKLKAAGKSDKEIKRAVKKLHMKFKAEQAKKQDELAGKEKALIEKMSADGASKAEIKDAIAKLHAKYKMAGGNPGGEMKVASYDEQKLIAKMKADGASKEQIKDAIAKLRAKREQELISYEQKLIAKMQADGASKEQIKKAIMELRKKKGYPPPKSAEDATKKEKLLYKQMKAAGMSEEEIKKVLKEMQARQKKAEYEKQHAGEI